MKNIILLWCFGTLALAAGDTVTVSISAPAKGPLEVIVRNHGVGPVTAYAYTLKWAGGSRDEFEDSSMALDRRPVFPNAAEVRRPAGAGANATVVLRAALFADGSSFGDPAWVARMAARRRYALEAVKASHDKLAAGVAAKTSRQALAASFASAAKSPAGKADADQQQVWKQHYERLADRLRKTTPDAALRDQELLEQKLTGALSNLAAN